MRNGCKQLTPNGKQFAVSSFKQWLYNKKFVKDYETGLINKLPLLFAKEQKHTYTFSELSDIIKIKLEQINEDKYLNRLVRQILNYLLESEIVSDNDVSYIKKKLKTKQYNADNYVPTDTEIQKNLSKLTTNNRLVSLVSLVSGVRKVELNYLIKNLNSLRIQKFDNFVKITMNYLRNTKNSYFCYLPNSIYKKLTKNSKQLSVSSLENEIKRKKLIPIKYCRKWFYTKCIELGIPESIADYYQGRVSNSVGGNHYLSRQLLADQNYKEIVRYFNCFIH
jgi:intergrase/recombinase